MLTPPASETSYRQPAGIARLTWQEILVGIAVVGVVTLGVWKATVTTAADRQRMDTTAAILTDLSHAVTALGGFQSTIGVYPGALSQLTTPIWNTVESSSNSCGNQFTDDEVANWDRGGPFVAFYIPVSGLVTPVGTIADTLHRVPQAAAPGFLAMVIEQASERDARLLDERLDDADGAAAGRLQWKVTAKGTTLSYAIPVQDGC